MNLGGHSEQTLAAAMAQHRAGRLTDAERLYRLVCDADPNNARAFHLLGVVAHQLRRPDAASLVGRAVLLDPDFAEAHNDRGVILAANGLFADALSCFERAVALNPGYSEARNNLGRGLRSLGRFDEALTQFELVLKSAPDSPVAHFNLASVFELIGRNPDAEKHYRSAIALRPDFVDAYIHLASLLQSTDRLPEALAHAERAVTLRPDSAGARNNLGNILRTMGRRDDAIAQYETALRIDPNSFMAHYNCGVALRGETRIAEARAHFARAFALKPDFLEAELALCMAELPALYEDESEVAERRDAYASRLARLCADVESASAPVALADAIGSHQPFYLPYQGCNDRELPILVWFAGLQNHGCEIRAACLAKPSGPARTDQVGYRQRLFQAALELEDSDQGMAQDAGPGPISCDRLLHERRTGWRDRRGGSIVRTFRTGPAAARCLAANDPGRCASCSDFSRNRDGQGVGATGGPAAGGGSVLFLGTPCHQRISDDRLLSSAAISWSPQVPRITIPNG